MTNYYPQHPSLTRPSSPAELPKRASSTLQRPEHYLPDSGLVDAINVALMLRQPLIVTGEPGTGKTSLAWSIAWELGLDDPLVFETKSSSVSKDLFYYYDTLGRFTAKELRADSGSAKDYISYNALGLAIVLTNEPGAVSAALPAEFQHPGKRRSVVLIDEVEKAPRDFANDILNELEQLYFRIPELGNMRIDADPALAPIVIMTNNSEKTLPDAFLRRCIYYHISVPTGEQLENIVAARLPEFVPIDRTKSNLGRDAVAFFSFIRQERAGLDKRPGTAELLNWLTAMVKLGAQPKTSLKDQRVIAQRAFTALVKISGDQIRVQELLQVWCGEQPKT